MGGTGTVVSGLSKLFEELGGKIHFPEIEQIAVNNSRVTGVILKDEGFIPADIVVSNAKKYHFHLPESYLPNSTGENIQTVRLKKCDTV